MAARGSRQTTSRDTRKWSKGRRRYGRVRPCARSVVRRGKLREWGWLQQRGQRRATRSSEVAKEKRWGNPLVMRWQSKSSRSCFSRRGITGSQLVGIIIGSAVSNITWGDGGERSASCVCGLALARVRWGSTHIWRSTYDRHMWVLIRLICGHLLLHYRSCPLFGYCLYFFQ